MHCNTLLRLVNRGHLMVPVYHLVKNDLDDDDIDWTVVLEDGFLPDDTTTPSSRCLSMVARSNIPRRTSVLLI